ncbi:AzlC family ABC transporter permease [Tumebacillus flagellatus]|uniref:Branched-chain amino acid ABC transporter permease n=1 Tax=Tumebacillus flagellatus TaxID=1157490 RepID=A0A074MCN5_9BACL|nr:AzlC family ABC transporter permease [Tumebacillus flagellatus]KEO83617.1 branched-chain amino acid ABC transporter permease [Tumebacillus flagellatus]
MSQSVVNSEERPDSSPVVRGVLQALPVVMGYIPIGFAYGVLAGQAHLSLFSTLLMSLIVYAGSSQLIAAGLFASGQPMLSIIFTTFIVNLRHLLMSAAVSPYLARWPQVRRLLFAAELTDESFALHSVQFGKRVPAASQVFAVNITAHLSWIFGSWLGFVANTMLTDVKPFGLDYALPAMFVALLLLQIHHWKAVGVALFSGIVAVVFQVAGFATWSVMLATVLGASLGVVLESWTKKQSG